MAILADIPEREGLTPTDQLNLLRAYLRDTTEPYTYTDDYLILVLILQDKDSAYKSISGDVINAYNYNTPPLEDKDRVRYLIGDTTELSLRYTDSEIIKYLNNYPLVYLVEVLKILELPDQTTYPTDVYHPIHIVREYLEEDDLNTTSLTDQDIVKNLLATNKDPYSYVIDIISGKVSLEVSIESGSGLSNLATFDGISFENSTESLSVRKENLEYIYRIYETSPYSGLSNTYYMIDDGFYSSSYVDGESYYE